jgi:peptidoglycan/xylan/chitin deacetylase (PgdA/CDA1 family)
MLPRLKTLITTLAGSVLALAAMTSALQAACASSKSLGVSRTITVDASGGKLFGGLQYRVDNDLLKDREVILTFDDGPARRYTSKVLKALASHCTKATFFMVGRMAVSDPKMVREVSNAGHTIASHTWSHRNLQQRSSKRAGGEIELGISAVRLAAQKPIAPFFRFPYLAAPRSMIAYGKSRNLAIFSIDIDSKDYKTKSSERVYGTIMRQLRSRGKGNMLFHDIQSSTAGAMQRILDTMQREGFKIVHLVSESPVKTLSDFDEQAKTIMATRRTRVAAHEIKGGAFEKVASTRSTAKSAGSKRKLAVILKRGLSRSSLQSISAVKAAAARKARQQRRLDWRDVILNN